MKFYSPSDLVEPRWCERVAGLGLFAKRFIPVDSHLGLIRVESNKQIYRTDFGGYGNHSDSPNAETVTARMFENERVVGQASASFEFVVSKTMLKTIADVEMGEEVTWCYTLPEYDNAEWIRK